MQCLNKDSQICFTSQCIIQSFHISKAAKQRHHDGPPSTTAHSHSINAVYTNILYKQHRYILYICTCGEFRCYFLLCILILKSLYHRLVSLL